MAGSVAWEKMVDRYLTGKTPGDKYALRPVPIPEGKWTAERLRFLDGRTPAWLYACGPKPWETAVEASVTILWSYFCREMKCGEGYTRFRGDVPTYLMVLQEDDKLWAIGILGFEHFGREQLRIGDGYRLNFTWIHPLFRRMGLMSSAIELTEAELGVFSCLTPISRGMREILKKRGHPQADDMRGVDGSGHFS